MISSACLYRNISGFSAPLAFVFVSTKRLYRPTIAFAGGVIWTRVTVSPSFCLCVNFANQTSRANSLSRFTGTRISVPLLSFGPHPKDNDKARKQNWLIILHSWHFKPWTQSYREVSNKLMVRSSNMFFVELQNVISFWPLILFFSLC